MCSCASYVSRTYNAIDYVTRFKSRSNVEIAITRSVFIVQRGNKYRHNLWLTRKLWLVFKYENCIANANYVKRNQLDRDDIISDVPDICEGMQ